MKIDITLQEVFNKVWERAKTPVKCIDNGMCLYRNPDGSKNHCFVGVCIPDELYKPSMEEGGSVTMNREVRLLFDSRLHGPLQQLQHIHDSFNVLTEEWPIALTNFAKDHSLTIPE